MGREICKTRNQFLWCSRIEPLPVTADRQTMHSNWCIAHCTACSRQAACCSTLAAARCHPQRSAGCLHGGPAGALARLGSGASVSAGWALAEGWPGEHGTGWTHAASGKGRLNFLYSWNVWRSLSSKGFDRHAWSPWPHGVDWIECMYRRIVFGLVLWLVAAGFSTQEGARATIR